VSTKITSSASGHWPAFNQITSTCSSTRLMARTQFNGWQVQQVACIRSASAKLRSYLLRCRQRMNKRPSSKPPNIVDHLEADLDMKLKSTQALRQAILATLTPASSCCKTLTISPLQNSLNVSWPSAKPAPTKPIAAVDNRGISQAGIRLDGDFGADEAYPFSALWRPLRRRGMMASTYARPRDRSPQPRENVGKL
jgi:hypothetical protein